MNKIAKKKEPLPIGTPIKGGDKKCGNCGTEYSRAEIKVSAVYMYETYWINCANCYSTLVIRKEKS